MRRPTQRKSLSAKHTRRNRSKSPSRKQSTTKSNDQPRDQEIAKLKAEIKKTTTKNKEIKQVTPTWIILIKICKKLKLNEKSNKVQKTDQGSPKQEVNENAQ